MAPGFPSASDQRDLRMAAVAYVLEQGRLHGVLPWSFITKGFPFRGKRVRLANRPRGIFWPEELRTGALSIKTSVPRIGRLRRYDDEIGADTPYFRYAYQGDDPSNRDNSALRQCRQDGLPVIYFYGVAEALYRPLICRVVGEDQRDKKFHVSPVEVDALQLVALAGEPGARPIIERRYTITEVRRRLHQDKFRAAVLDAYGCQCAICRIRHIQLLDAAHIVPDAERLGEARVPNGLSLCKLHHAAYDSQLIGVTPERVVVLRGDLLTERDGPMLEFGLQAFHQRELQLPRAKDDWPDPTLLEERWRQFAA